MKPEHKAEMKARARNIVLKVAYDGTAYHGFQRQTPPVIAVQNVLEEKLQVVFGDSIELAASGRTDAGVHARGQVVNFFTNGRIPVDRIVRAVNSLPHPAGRGPGSVFGPLRLVRAPPARPRSDGGGPADDPRHA